MTFNLVEEKKTLAKVAPRRLGVTLKMLFLVLLCVAGNL